MLEYCIETSSYICFEYLLESLDSSVETEMITRIFLALLLQRILLPFDPNRR